MSYAIRNWAGSARGVSEQGGGEQAGCEHEREKQEGGRVARRSKQESLGMERNLVVNGQPSQELNTNVTDDKEMACRETWQAKVEYSAVRLWEFWYKATWSRNKRLHRVRWCARRTGNRTLLGCTRCGTRVGPRLRHRCNVGGKVDVVRMIGCILGRLLHPRCRLGGRLSRV